MRIATAYLGRHLIPLGLLILIGCAAGPSEPFSAKGTSGSIAWEITDVGSS
jgi:hypothetical protein